MTPFIPMVRPANGDGSGCKDTRNTDERWIEHIALREAMKNLTDREKRILALRFYDGRTQMEVASEVGISQAQVSRLEKGAISQIRKAISVQT